ncbi:hypothetical protein VTL71DRAFT_1294 [Oculimacula yallundae]|uniref:Uncharacterized protein n=1 Tax=Oculimacula yallundae TaxID=86028 RepID=A0ABR4CA99_9HELO
MDLSGVTEFLETQAMSFTSILKSTKNLDPVELKRIITKHHVELVMIAKEKYPIELTSPDPDTPNKPISGSGPGKGINKRYLEEDSSDEGDTYKPPAKTSSGIERFKHGRWSSSASTPIKRQKSTTPGSSNSHASSFNGKGRMQPAGASNLFKKEKNYTESPNGFKEYNVIDLSSDVDSEFEEAKEAEESDPDIVGSDGESRKRMPTRKGTAARRGQASRRGGSTRKSTPSKSKKTEDQSLEDYIADWSPESDEDFFGAKKGESSGTQPKKFSRAEMKKSSTANKMTPAEIVSVRLEISKMEKTLEETKAQLTKTELYLERKPILEQINMLKDLIESNKVSIGEGAKKKGRKNLAATVEDALDEDNDSLFLS